MALVIIIETYVLIPLAIGRKEGNVLFNDTLNTFYLLLYGHRQMVKDHSDSKRGNPLHHPIDRITHTTAFDTPVVKHWLEQEIAEWVHHGTRRPLAP